MLRSTPWNEDASSWWGRHRFGYNVGLIVAGVLAFVCYVIALDRRISDGSLPDAEFTIFTIAFQATGYLLMMGVANLCYFAGPLAENIFWFNDLERYRRVAFALGFWFSVLLPFTIPALVALG